MKHELIDPLFNNPNETIHNLTRKEELSHVVSSSLVSAKETPPRSPTTKHAMTLVEGAFKGKVFKMWVDTENRLAIPVRET